MQSAIELTSFATDITPPTSPVLETSSTNTPQPGHSESSSLYGPNEHGKPSVIYPYCQRAIDEGHEECIWLVMKRGRKWIAKDIQLGGEDKVLGILQLRKMSGWWKRHSMFSAIGVKEIKIRFLGVHEATNEVEIVFMDFQYPNILKGFSRDLDKAWDEDLGIGCEVDIMGQSRAPHYICNNLDFDSDTGLDFCRMDRIRDLEQQKEESEWLPSLLEYYWQNGIGTKGVKFLKRTRFVRSYQYEDALKPYGKTINAFIIVEGWHLRYLLCLFAAGVLCSICVVAIFTATTKSLASGLTAGSYTLAFAGIFLAILTFLSAVL